MLNMYRVSDLVSPHKEGVTAATCQNSTNKDFIFHFLSSLYQHVIKVQRQVLWDVYCSCADMILNIEIHCFPQKFVV